MLLFSTVGSLVGSLVLYTVGRLIGEESLRWFFKRFGRFVFVGEKDLDKASGWFGHHGDKTVLIARVLPGAGSVISLPAGIERMPLWRFMIYTALGNALYNATLVGLGWALGSQWTLVERYVPIIEYVVLAALAAGILWFVLRRWKARD